VVIYIQQDGQLTFLWNMWVWSSMTDQLQLIEKPSGTIMRDVETQHSGTIPKGTRVNLYHTSGGWVTCRWNERGILIALAIDEDVAPDEGALERLGT
jgi:hypothetical protein